MKKLICLPAVLVFLLCVHINALADSVILPENLTEIEEEAFFQDTGLTEVLLPDGAKTIGRRAFARSGLETIFIPESVDDIDPTAFDGLAEDFTIYSPGSSYARQYALDHDYHWHEGTDVRKSYTVESEIGGCFVVESIIDTGDTVVVKCCISSDYSGDSSTLFTVLYGVEGNCLYRDGLSLAALKRGDTFHFSKDEINRHNIPPVISLHVNGPDIKESYTVESEIGDFFIVRSITDWGDTVDVRCYISSEYSADSNTLFTVRYGVEGNYLYRGWFSLAALKRGDTIHFSKDEINRHNIPPVISLHIDGIDIKESYTVESEIGDYFVVQYIIDRGDTVDVRCYISSDYSADSSTLFTVSYGVEGNRIFHEGLTLEALKHGVTCGFSKSTINRYHIPPIISLRMGT